MKKWLLMILIAGCLSQFANAQQPLTRSEIIYFSVDQSTPYPASQQRLEKVAKVAREENLQAIVITGHTDNTGDTGYNEKLSRDRCEFINQYFSALPVDPGIIKMDAYGESKPISDNHSEKGRLANRRVEITLIYKERETPVTPVVNSSSESLAYLFASLAVPIQTCCFYPGRDTAYTFMSGTSVFIPGDAFALPPDFIPGNCIEFRIRECYAVDDWIKTRLSTRTVGGEIMESEGMLWLDAGFMNQPVRLNIGKKLTLFAPANSKVNNLQVFNGQKK